MARGGGVHGRTYKAGGEARRKLDSKLFEKRLVFK